MSDERLRWIEETLVVPQSQSWITELIKVTCELLAEVKRLRELVCDTNTAEDHRCENVRLREEIKRLRHEVELLSLIKLNIMGYTGER